MFARACPPGLLNTLAIARAFSGIDLLLYLLGACRGMEKATSAEQQAEEYVVQHPPCWSRTECAPLLHSPFALLNTRLIRSIGPPQLGRELESRGYGGIITTSRWSSSQNETAALYSSLSYYMRA